MWVSQDDHVCTLLRLDNFGEETYGDTWENPLAISKISPSAANFEEFKTRLFSRLKEFLQTEGEFCLAAYGAILAVTVDTQPIAAGFLKEFGFKRCLKVKSGKYPNTPCTYWLISTKKVIREIGEPFPSGLSNDEDDDDDWSW